MTPLLVLLLILPPSLGLPSPPSSISWPYMPVRAMPVVHNYLGSSNTLPDLISLAPIPLAGFVGTFNNSTVTFNAESPKLTTCEWRHCEAIRGGETASQAAPVSVQVATRMPVDERVIVQKTSITGARLGTVTSMFWDGPFFRTCDDGVAADSSGCGWGLTLPTDKASFDITVSVVNGTAVALVADTLTAAVSATTLTSDCPSSTTTIEPESQGFRVISSCPTATSHSLTQTTAVGGTSDAATALLLTHTGPGTFCQACDEWESRYVNSFDPLEDFFEGNLPTLTTSSTELTNLYTWSTAAQVSLLRTNYPSSPHQYVISEGPSNSPTGETGMGGAGQFIWDLSFSAGMLTLLDPAFPPIIIKHMIANADFTSRPIGLIQAWDAYPAYPNTVGPGQYCFDYVASFLFVKSYVTMTGDVDVLTERVVNNHDGESYTGVEFLRRIANNYEDYPRSAQSPFLVDYGDDKRNFLEAAPSYTNVIAGLQVGNAGMMKSLAGLLQMLGAAEQEIETLEQTAEAIMRDVVKYQAREGGWFACLNKTAGVEPVDVRALSDHVYVGLGVGYLGDMASMLPDALKKDMVTLFMEEYLSGNGWVRAISLKDESMKNVDCEPAQCTTLDKVSMRSDWTATGGYGGLMGASVDALADLDTSFDHLMEALMSASVVADAEKGTMPGQGIAVMTTKMFLDYLGGNGDEAVPEFAFAPNFPEFFDSQEQASGFPASWPSTSRSIQNAEGSIADAVIRSVFGWRPGWAFGTGEAGEDIAGAIWRGGERRGDFEGKLENVRTPHGLLDLEAGKDGITWSWSIN